jgi:hypothetical protein
MTIGNPADIQFRAEATNEFQSRLLFHGMRITALSLCFLWLNLF